MSLNKEEMTRYPKNRAARRRDAKWERGQAMRDRIWRVNLFWDLDKNAKQKRIQRDHDAAHAKAVARRKLRKVE